MRKSLPMILGILLSVGLLTHAFAAGVGLPTVGSRAVNLGGAYRALSGDWSAGYWNPAGLTRVQGWNAGINATTIIPGAQVQPAPFEGRSFYGYTTDNIDTKPKTFFIPTLGVVNSLDNGFSWSFALFVPFGLGATWDIWSPVPGYNSAAYPEEEFESDLQVIDLHFSGAYKVTDQLSLGFGVGLLHTNILIRQPKLSKPFEGTALQPLVTAPHDVLVTDLKLEGSGLGLSLNAGLIYDISEKWSVGASVRYYPDMVLDGEVTADNYYTGDPQTVATLDALLAAGQIDNMTHAGATNALSGTKQNFISDDDAEATMPLPMNAGIGIAYRPTERLLFSFDTEWTQWSSWDAIPLDKIEAVDGSDQSTELVEDWDDAMRYNFGAEYIAMKSMDSELALRLGYYHETNPVPDETITPTIPDINNRNEIVVGGGYSFGNITLNLAYVHIFVGEREVPEWNLEQDAFGVENVAGIYNADVNEFHVGLEFNF